jgi:holliday junction DNA helicase RuvA
MIAQLCGNPVSKGDGFIVLDVGGIGYRINMTTTDIASIAVGSVNTRIFTHLVVREDLLALYGFIQPPDLEVFQLLITINRVGPQLALSVLSQIPAQEFVKAVSSEDEKRLTRLTGIGPRNAKRLILELKDRMKERLPIEGTTSPEVPGTTREDVAGALIGLGFPSRESYDAVDETCRKMKTTDSQALLKASLLLLKEKKKI